MTISNHTYNQVGTVIKSEEQRYTSTDIEANAHGNGYYFDYSLNTRTSHHRYIKIWLKDKNGKEAVFEFYNDSINTKEGDEVVLVCDKKTHNIIRVINKNLNTFYKIGNLQKDGFYFWYFYLNKYIFGIKNKIQILFCSVVPFLNILFFLIFVTSAFMSFKDKILIRQLPWLLLLVISIPVAYLPFWNDGELLTEFSEKSEAFSKTLFTKSLRGIYTAIKTNEEQTQDKENILNRLENAKNGWEAHLAQEALNLREYGFSQLYSKYLYNIKSKARNNLEKMSIIDVTKIYAISTFIFWVSLAMFFQPLFRKSKKRILEDEEMLDKYCTVKINE